MSLLPVSLRLWLIPAVLVLASPAFADTAVTLVNSTPDHWFLMPETMDPSGRFSLVATVQSEQDPPGAPPWATYFLVHDGNGPVRLTKFPGKGHPYQEVSKIAVPPWSSVRLHAHCLSGPELSVTFRLGCAMGNRRAISGSATIENWASQPFLGLHPVAVVNKLIGKGMTQRALTEGEVLEVAREGRAGRLDCQFENAPGEPRFTFSEPQPGVYRLEEQGAAASYRYPGDEKASQADPAWPSQGSAVRSPAATPV
jgi:hypothetical protein